MDVTGTYFTKYLRYCTIGAGLNAAFVEKVYLYSMGLSSQEYLSIVKLV